MKEDTKVAIGVWLDDWGYKMGFLFISAPIIYDTLGLGFRGFFEWRISYWGVLCQLVGLVLIGLTLFMRRYWK